MNDYTGKLLHDAHYRDLINEARSESLLKASRAAGSPQPPRSTSRRRHLTLIWATLSVLAGALMVAAIAALGAAG